MRAITAHPLVLPATKNPRAIEEKIATHSHRELSCPGIERNAPMVPTTSTAKDNNATVPEKTSTPAAMKT
jgi:hypothetical protein